MGRGDDGGLWFYLADASGHGDAGAGLWQALRTDFDREWLELTTGPCSAARLEHFSARINDFLMQSEVSRGLQLCIAVGAISCAGTVGFATFGFGVHLLATTLRGAWSFPGDAALSLKLGWVPSTEWSELPGSVVVHNLDRVTRLILLSDAFLGDDYADVTETMRVVRGLGDASARLLLPEVVPYFQRIPHDRDDASLLVIELDSA